jgi:hypothetical protein
VRLQSSRGFSRQELHRIQQLIEEQNTELVRSWNEYFHD